MALEKGSSIMCYVFVIFGVGSSESVSHHSKLRITKKMRKNYLEFRRCVCVIQNVIEKNEEKENYLEKSAFVDCSTPGPFSCFYIIWSFCSCFVCPLYNSNGTESRFYVTSLCQEGEKYVIKYTNHL